MVVDDKVVPQTDTQPKTAHDYLGYPPEVFEGAKTGANRHTESEPVNVQDKINQVLKDIKVDDKGKFIYPEGISPELKAAVAATKSFRDTQSSYTKSQQESKATKAELEALKAELVKYETPTSGLSPADQSRLAELKFTNPDAWYKEMKKLEDAAGDRVEEKFRGVQEQARTKTVQEMRLDALADYNKDNDNQLTTDQLDLDVPARWKQEVEAGTLDFEVFLTRAADFIYSNKVVENPDVPQTTNLNNAAGGTKDPEPDNKGIDYSKVTF